MHVERRVVMTLFLAIALLFADGAVAKLSNVSTGNNWGLCPGEGVAVLYVYGGAHFKPYVKTLSTPAGVNILRDSPADHLHHHGLMFAVRANNINFWEETSESGKQVHVSITGLPGGGEGFIEKLKWVAPNTDNTQLEERRTLTAYPIEGVTLLTWQSALHGLDGPPAPTYSGTNYNGLGMRFVESMDKGGVFFNADGASGVAGTVGAKSRWCAYHANAGDKPVTVAMFDHPANVRYPAVWYTMDTPFAYLSATLALDKQPLQQLDLVLTYGVAAWDGHVDAKTIEEVYGQWLKLVEPLTMRSR